jgi:hypothetical protein
MIKNNVICKAKTNECMNLKPVMAEQSVTIIME